VNRRLWTEQEPTDSVARRFIRSKLNKGHQSRQRTASAASNG